AHDRRDVLELHERPSLEAELGDESPVGSEQLRRLARLIVIQLLDRGTLSRTTDERPTRVREAGNEKHPECAGQINPTHEARMSRAKSRAFGFAGGFGDAVLLLRH